MTSPDGNGASGAFGTGPASGYNLIHVCLYLFLFIRCLNLNTAAYLFLFISCLNLNTSTYYLVTESLNIVIIIFYMFNFGIKIYRNMPRILTIKNLILLIGFRYLVLLRPLSRTYLMVPITSVGVRGLRCG